MPSEFRHIVFTDEEVAAAVADARRRQGSPLPTSRIVSLRILQTASGTGVMLCMQPHADSLVVNLAVGADELRQCLIAFCLNRLIPLPVRSIKSVEMFGGQLALTVTRDATDEARRRMLQVSEQNAMLSMAAE